MDTGVHGISICWAMAWGALRGGFLTPSQVFPPVSMHQELRVVGCPMGQTIYPKVPVICSVNKLIDKGWLGL